MKRRLVVATVLCLVLLATIAVTATPSALAQAETRYYTGTEIFVASTMTAYEVRGGFAFMEFDNVFWDESSVNDPTMDGYQYTHLWAKAELVNGVPTDSIMRGTFHKEALDGTVWEGTFNGTMDFVDLTWKCVGQGKAASGPCAGQILLQGWNVKTDPGPPPAAAVLNGRVLAPQGF